MSARNPLARRMDAPPEVPRVGAAIRRLRLARGLSLQALALRAGVSLGMLSQVERNRANPSLRILTRIQAALGARPGDLFEDRPAEEAEPGFVRRREGRAACDLGTLTKQLLTAPAARNLEIMLLDIPAGGTSGDQPLVTAAEKGGLVLAGRLQLTVGGAEALLLEGDSFAIGGAEPHAFRNPGPGAAQVLWIIANLPMQRAI